MFNLMRKYYPLTLIIVFTINVLNSQVMIGTGEVIYKKKMIDSYKKDSMKEDPLFNQASLASELHNFTLSFNINASKFIFHENLGLGTSAKERYNSKLSSLLCNDYNYYYDSKNKVGIQDYDGTLVSDDTKINWNITNESKTISGFLTYKATYSSSIINHKGELKEILINAWFAPSIPIPYGPKNYNSLPGLILELQDMMSIIYATDIKLNLKEKIKLDFPKGKVLSKEEYRKMIKTR
jgi:GLPGLI family protein